MSKVRGANIEEGSEALGKETEPLTLGKYIIGKC